MTSSSMKYRVGDKVRINKESSIKYSKYSSSIYLIKDLYRDEDDPEEPVTGFYLTLVEGIPFMGDLHSTIPWTSGIFELALPDILPDLREYE